MAEDARNVDFWTKQWTGENPDCASAKRHGWLAKEGSLEKLLRGRPNQKIFFPLCGDTLDMKWMVELGHKVIGADLGAGAFENFFKKHNIPYSKEKSDKCQGYLYKSDDDNYRLYCCDFFNFNRDLEGQFDVLFDSGALVAIHRDLRQKYAAIMTSLMTPDSVHIVEGVKFEEICWEGPPYGLVEDELKAAYEPLCSVERFDHYVYQETYPGEPDENGECKDVTETMNCTMFYVTLKTNCTAEDSKLIDHWKKLWDGEKQMWSTPEKHVWLAKGDNINKLLRGRPNQKVFLPLCGDAVDLKWLGDLGHTVIGADLSEEAFQRFFKKYDIPYTKEVSVKCKGYLYKSNDDKYRFYCCDFFNFNSAVEGQFDALFDSGALVAIHPDLRKQYAGVMKSLMSPDSVHIVEGITFDKIFWEGPPFGLVEGQLRAAYEPECRVEQLDSYVFVETVEGNTETMNCNIFTVSLQP